ncbi:DUF3159 domain-containing protein [Marinitenerispora sediminis]|uniref:DUF3159 domain-containing protein n=1 Tax=Marinitenerispora sediminis TaxID=1931232 RepID=A0A368T3F5_9ACTN|nr:DUF3159 domain-containing protein [Marinitenerispora sediminis]RCV49482.1 DUF3159 domain-containing protein [Marinitenerispora sediminis]RCV57005.1 DUF3159 domain-containing protein [Marinitenerispora sediminis]RCV58647.1 DUF3159 domain-containing protein [Marinitenerispora sediminis]
MTDHNRTADTGRGPDSAGPAGGGDQDAARPVSEQTVEAVIRGQLAKALGGKRGMAEAAVPTIAFTGTYLLTTELRTALWLGVGAAVLLAAIRLVQRSSVQFVVNSLFGIGIAAVFALRSGQAEDAFLPGIIYNAVYALVLIVTILVRWPAIGLLIGAVTGDPAGWRANPAILRLSSRLTWLLVLPCVVRVAVQYPLWLFGGSDVVGWLGIAKIAMGWPLQVAALAAMVWLLSRDRTPIEQPAQPAEPGGR